MDDKVMIKGVLVSFSKLAINLHYGLRDLERGEYMTYLEDVEYDEVIQTLIVG